VTQVVAKFGGLDVQVTADMARTPGVVPDVGQVVWRAGTTQPSNPIADLVFYYNGAEVTRWHDCILDDPKERRGTYRDMVYRVKDRRWAWQDAVIESGEYNVRDEFGEDIIEVTKKTPRELAAIALDALGEATYDVSVLPTDEVKMPHTKFRYTLAAEFLQKLCGLMGCSVHLLPDNTIQVIQDGVGSIPDDTNLEETPAIGLLIDPAPDNVKVIAEDTLFDSWLLLEAVAPDMNGTVKPIEMLSYRPTNGWYAASPKDLSGEAVAVKATFPGWNDDDKERAVDLTTRHIHKTYRVIGYSPGMTEPGGTDFIGFTIGKENATGLYHVVDIETNTFLDAGHATRILAEDARRTNGNEKLVIAPPGHTVFDTRQVTPLEDKRLLFGFGPTGQLERSKAEISGNFTPYFMGINSKRMIRYGGVTNLNAHRLYREGFSIDVEKGYVTLQQPAVKQVVDDGEPSEDDKFTTEHPLLYLRTGFRMRQELYGVPYHRGWTEPTGNTMGLPDAIVHRPDLQQQVIVTYTDDYVDLSVTGAPQQNTTTIDETLEKTADEFMKRYKNLDAPYQKKYTPIRNIATNGKVKQVQFSCGVGRIGRTIASIGAEHDRAQPTGKQKLLREVQAKAAETEMKKFVPTVISPIAEVTVS